MDELAGNEPKDGWKRIITRLEIIAGIIIMLLILVVPFILIVL
jgi:hypothetical protein